MPQPLAIKETHVRMPTKCLIVMLTILSLVGSVRSSNKSFIEQNLPANISGLQQTRYEPIAAIVKAQKANLRELPSNSAVVIRTVNKGDLLALVEATPIGPWYQVRDSKTDAQGWIHGNTIALLQTIEPGSANEIAPQTPRLTSPRVSGRSYVNVDRVRVPSPMFSETKPDGAMARCRDGSYSFSQHRRGTCSYHGGVAEWY